MRKRLVIAWLFIALVAAIAEPLFAGTPPPPPPTCDPPSVFFDPGKTELSADALQVIAGFAFFMRQRPGLVVITGHTDDAEGDDKALSERRAAAVKQELVRLGANPNEMQTEGKGSSDPLVRASPSASERLNRRAFMNFCVRY